MKGDSSPLVGHSFIFFWGGGDTYSKRLILNWLREREIEQRERVVGLAGSAVENV